MRMVLAWAGLDPGVVPDGWERHVPLYWRDLEPSEGQYLLPSWILQAEARPLHLQVVISTLAHDGPVDHTPPHHKRSLRLKAPNTGRIGEMPPYGDVVWRRAFYVAIEALAAQFRDEPQVVGFWLGAGLDNETQCMRLGNDGSDWVTPCRSVVLEDEYLSFIGELVDVAVRAWGRVPVYLPGGPSPGSVWGHRRRDVIADALERGARYQCCALLPDNPNAMGVGGHEGFMLYDIIRSTGARCAFENGKSADMERPGELYWMLLRAAHWQAEFVDLFREWLPLWDQVKGDLPVDGSRWVVFRDREFPVQLWGDWGWGGEPGDWGVGLARVTSGELRFNASRLDAGRWVLTAAEGLVLRASGLADGRYQVAVRRPDGRESLTVMVRREMLELPAGEYHRVDVVGPAPLTIEERVASLERRVDALEGANAVGV